MSNSPTKACDEAGTDSISHRMDTGHIQPYAVSEADHVEHAGYHAPLEALAKLDYRIKQLNAAIESNGAAEPAWDAASMKLHDEVIECRIQQVAYRKVLLERTIAITNVLSSRQEIGSTLSLSIAAALGNLASAIVALAEAYARGFYFGQCSRHIKSAIRIAEDDILSAIEGEKDTPVVRALNERLQADIASCQGYACYQAFIAQLEQGVDQTHPVADLDAMQREVLALLDAALDQTRRRYGEKDLRCARLQELIAKVYVNRMQNSYAAGGEHEYLDLAKEHYEQARAIRVHRLGASSRAVLEISVGVAQAEMLAGREKEAVKMMIQTLQSIEDAETEITAAGIESWFFIDHVLQLSHWTTSSDDAATNNFTMQMLVKAHELATSTYKPTDRRVVDVMRDLALRAVKSEEHEKARRYLSEILEVEEQIHGQYSVPVCRTLNALASVLIALEGLEDAKAVLSKARLIVGGLLSCEKSPSCRDSLGDLLRAIQGKLMVCGNTVSS